MADQEYVSAEEQTAWKLAAARAAVATVPDGAVIGLGTGTTASLMLPALAERIREGLRVTGVPTSEHTRAEALSLGIPLIELDSVPTLTLSIDGADEVTLPQLNLVKGQGGALLREKLIATASRYRIIIVDATKIVPALATRHTVPVEVVPFGWKHTAGRLASLGCQPALRRAAGSVPGDPVAAPFITDGGHYVLDCRFAPIAQPEVLAAEIKAITGVIDHGLFIGMTERLFVGGPGGVQVHDRPR